jgi:Pentapeptide repeats (8 copies)
MSDAIERIRQVADSLSSLGDAENIRKSAELFKLLAEIENQHAQAKKIEEDLLDVRVNRKTKDRKEIIALLAPVVTTVVLAGTLVLQGVQFARTEKDKDLDAQRQREATAVQTKRLADEAEDTRWAEALKLLSSSEKISPAAVLLNRFTKSLRYAGEARLTAEKVLLLNSLDSGAFQNLFGSVFVPVTWENLSMVEDINRQLYQKVNPIMVKAWDDKKKTLIWGKVSKREKHEYDELDVDLDYISEQLAFLLKGKRDANQSLGFYSMALWDTDLQGADLSGADLSSSNLSNLNLIGANLTTITKFNWSVFSGSAWWEASAISPELRVYLEERYPFDMNATYASGRTYSKAEFEMALTRLSGAQK